jgi:hypothetical protein
MKKYYYVSSLGNFLYVAGIVLILFAAVGVCVVPDTWIQAIDRIMMGVIK